jgi:hypothetical protein
VPRETYEKLMAEKKNWAEKAKAVETELETIKTAQLKEKEDYKAMYEMSQKKAQEYEVKLKEREEAENRAIKLTKVKQEWSKLGLKDSEPADALLQIVNLDAVKYDPELKVVLGAEEEAKRIFEKFQPMFKTGSPKPNHDAPQGIPATVSMESYSKAIKDGSFAKLSKDEQRKYISKLYEAGGAKVK